MHDLQAALSRNDANRNEILVMEQNSKFAKVQSSFVAEQLKALLSAFHNVGSVKQIESRRQHENAVTADISAKQLEELTKLRKQVEKLKEEREQNYKDMKENIDAKDKVTSDKNQFVERFTKRVSNLEKEVYELTEQLKVATESVQSLDKQNRILVAEKLKLIEKIKKMKMMRGKFEADSKTCKKCGKDYFEKENFNWSCCTHQSEYSGELWWCCGKTQKNALGCKF